MTKKFLALLLALSLLVCAVPSAASAAAADPIKIFYIGKEITFPVPPQIIGNSTMVPMRKLFETFGYTVDWDSETKTVTASNEDYIIILTIGSTKATVNIDEHTLDTAPVIVGSSTLIPLRFVGEASGYIVTWNDADRSVTIEYNEEMKTALAEKQAAYIEDLTTIKTQLPVLHKNLFFYKSRESFNNEMDALIKDVPNLSLTDNNFQIMKIINSVNDTHTTASFSTMGYPLKFYQFSDGIYLIDSPRNYENFIGKKLTAINGVPIEEVIKKLSPITPFDNEAWASYISCQYLSNTTFLKEIGVIDSTADPIPFNFGDKTLTPANGLGSLPMVSTLEEKTVSYPLSYMDSSAYYWYTVLPESKTVYAKYTQCAENPGYSMADFAKDIFNDVKSNGASTLVLDLRDNTGGNSEVINPLITEILKNTKINTRGHFYVIVGRKTFSSGILDTIRLKKLTNAIFVGETTGGSPNHYGNPKNFYLPNLGVRISYSTQFYQTVSENVRTFTPNIVVPLKAASFFAGKDDFLDAILKK